MTAQPTQTPDSPRIAEREARVNRAQAAHSLSLSAQLVKIILLGLFDAVMVFTAITAAIEEAWLVFAGVAAITIVINVIYLPPNRLLPGKYLAPGVAFMLIFSVSVALYTVYASFTNYGDGHNGSKNDAIVAIQKANQVRVPDSPEYPAAVAERNDDLWLLVVDPASGDVLAGSNDTPLAQVSGVQFDSRGRPIAADDFRVLDFAELSQRQAEVAAMQVPISDDSTDGFIRTTTGSVAYVYTSTMVYDPATDTFTDPSGRVYRDGGEGLFVDEAGNSILPGWKINVGLDNYVSAVTDPDIRAPFLRVLVWTFVFSIVSVATTFALGLALAMVFNVRLRGQRIYRGLMILPYAFPAAMMIMVWSGLLNRDFGFINQVILGGADVAWLTSPTLAKVSLLIVNLWLGFPYQFLVCTGALQSLPDEVLEAAQVDGASPLQTFFSIKLPLLMVSLAPLLISSFAFNFNNFNLVYLLTRGGPRFGDTSLDVGASDILISMVYKVAFGDLDRLYGLGSAFAFLIFVIVGFVSWLGFRQTRALEDIN